MQKCSQCNKLLKVGDEVHIVDEQIFCSDECAVVYLTNEIICSAKETAKETYNDNVTVLTIRPTKDSARCKICGQNLAER